MKRFLLLTGILFALGLTATAQSTETQEKIYRQALGFNDLTAATQAVFEILANSPENSPWLDTLALLYFQRGAYDQARRVATKIVKENPKNLQALELLAVSEQSVGNLQGSLKAYSQLYPQTGNIFHLYEISTLHYSLKDFESAQIAIGKILSDPGLEGEEITLNTGPNQRQKVPLRAAVYNLQGVTFLDQKNPDKAKQSFEAALKLEPTFVLAKNNLEYLKKLSEEEK